jgi:hypothetical protein
VPLVLLALPVSLQGRRLLLLLGHFFPYFNEVRRKKFATVWRQNGLPAGERYPA